LHRTVGGRVGVGVLGDLVDLAAHLVCGTVRRASTQVGRVAFQRASIMSALSAVRSLSVASCPVAPSLQRVWIGPAQGSPVQKQANARREHHPRA
jgi:hypothetical protein